MSRGIIKTVLGNNEYTVITPEYGEYTACCVTTDILAVDSEVEVVDFDNLPPSHGAQWDNKLRVLPNTGEHEYLPKGVWHSAEDLWSGGFQASLVKAYIFGERWRKECPIYRRGTITQILSATHALVNVWSSPISDATSIILRCRVDYMATDTAAFAVGDEVVVKFEDSCVEKPVVVGSWAADEYLIRFMAYGPDGDIYLYENSVWSKVADGNGVPFSVKLTSPKWGLPTGVHWFTGDLSIDLLVYTWTLYHLNKTTYEWDYFDEWEHDRDDEGPTVSNWWPIEPSDFFWSDGQVPSLYYTSYGIAFAAWHHTDTGQYTVQFWDGDAINEWAIPLGGGSLPGKPGELVYWAFRDSVPYGIGLRMAYNYGWFAWTGYKRKIEIFNGTGNISHILSAGGGYDVWNNRFGRGVAYCISNNFGNESCVIDTWRDHGESSWPLFNNRYMDYPYNDDSIAYIVGGLDVPEADRYKIYQIPLAGTDFNELTLEDGTQVGTAFPYGNPRGLRVIDEGLES